MRILKKSLAILKRCSILIVEEIFRRSRKMEQKLEGSYVYDPERGTLECNAKYNGVGDSFCALFEERLTLDTVQEFVNGFLQYLVGKLSSYEIK